MKKLSSGIILSSIVATYLMGNAGYDCSGLLVTTDADDGDSSLRVCVSQASNGDIVAFDGDHNIVLSSPIYINSKTITIDGGANTVVIDGNDSTHLFSVNAADTTFSHLTFQDGNATQGGAVFSYESNVSIENSTIQNSNALSGGAIYSSEGGLEIRNSLVSSNSSEYGGAIHSYKSAVNIVDSNITFNTSEKKGGGVFVYNGALNITSSNISHNSAYSNTNTTNGGGIFIDKSPLTISESRLTDNNATFGAAIESHANDLTILSSIISNNHSTDSGIIEFVPVDSDSDLTVRDSTVSNNSAPYGASAFLIFNGDGNTSTTIEGSTISNNNSSIGYSALFVFGDVNDTVAILNSTISGNIGGALNCYTPDSSVFLGHVTVTENTIGQNAAVEGAGEILVVDSIISGNSNGDDFAIIKSIYGGFNILGTGTFVVDENTITDIRTNDPQLGPLTDNGGPTWTHLPLSTSPAIDAGDSPLEYDQRGVSRPQGSAPDIGSVEVEKNYAASPAVIMYLLN